MMRMSTCSTDIGGSYYDRLQVTWAQGSNAHAVLCASEAAPVGLSASGGHHWRHQRFWYTPAPHAMLHVAAAALDGQLTRFTAQFAR